MDNYEKWIEEYKESLKQKPKPPLNWFMKILRWIID